MPKISCLSCGGRGSYDAIGERACSGCAGTGRDYKHSKLMSKPCSRCHGSGRESYCEKRTCSSCNGKGYTNYWNLFYILFRCYLHKQYLNIFNIKLIWKK